MSSPRTHVAELVHLLNEAKQPVYVLDEELTIVFLNRACRQWLGAAAAGLLGRTCAYHSAPAVDPSDAVAAALCPPPTCLTGEVAAATVAAVAEDGRATVRRARFLPIGLGGEDLLGILAVVDTVDETAAAAGEPSPETAEPGPIDLHETIRQFRQEAAVRYRADRLIGQGHAMRLVRRQVELAAAGRSSVLLVGPQGSGRRHLAAAIHYGSKGVGSLYSEAATKTPDSRKGDCPHLPERPEGCFAQKGTVPFSAFALVPLDCSLLGGDLLAAAGTAMARAAMRTDQAAPCTLLFHRIDELPAETQVQLVDFLARPAIQARLMATAAESLIDLARRGNFHAELAAMLSTITIELPPLAQRRDDLPLLAQLFLEERNAAGSHQVGGLQAALDRLDAYAWPGNLDELSEVVAEAHRRAAGSYVEVKDLPDRLHLVAQAAAQPRRAEETIVLDEYLGRVERELIRRALARAKGNKARAARLLGVTRPRLYRRMLQLGLE